ncbi:glycogen synthase GlgA [Albidovulum sp.]
MTLRVLAVASECAPFAKTGGLADVVGALAKALRGHDTECRVLMPLYRPLAHLAEGSRCVLDGIDAFGGPVRVLARRAKGIELLLIEAPHLYDRPGQIYLDQTGADWADNHRRFGLLGMIGARIAREGIAGWRPDVVHAHDWQAGLVPVYLRQQGAPHPPCVITIHNIAFQGLFAASTMGDLGLDPSGFTQDGFEYFGRIGFLKGGLMRADRITTVSPTYARELMTPEFGMGLEGVLSARRAVLTGILNGIDTEIWDPAADPALAQTFSARTLARRRANRLALLDRFGLADEPTAPLLSIVSRLTEQKGLDLALQCLPAALARGARLVVLGSGSPDLERGFSDLAARHPGRVGVRIGFDEDLAHLVQAGADAIVIPSRFEPCGLTQLCAMRYGSVPIVSRTGGLADTVIDANEAALAAGCATGLQFAPVTAARLGDALDRAMALYRDRRTWERIMRNGMKHPVGWDRSAARVVAIYRDLAGDGS